MSERRQFRSGSRSDAQICAHAGDIELLHRIARGEIRNSPELRMELRRLARDDLILCGFGVGTIPTMLPRGNRLLAAMWGEVPAPRDESNG